MMASSSAITMRAVMNAGPRSSSPASTGLGGVHVVEEPLEQAVPLVGQLGDQRPRALLVPAEPFEVVPRLPVLPVGQRRARDDHADLGVVGNTALKCHLLACHLQLLLGSRQAGGQVVELYTDAHGHRPSCRSDDYRAEGACAARRVAASGRPQGPEYVPECQSPLAERLDRA